MFKQLCKHLGMNWLLSSAFRSTARVKVSKVIFSCIDEAKLTFLRMLDFLMTFDTITILLSKLEFYGMKGIALQLFTHYYKDHCQIKLKSIYYGQKKSIRFAVYRREAFWAQFCWTHGILTTMWIIFSVTSLFRTNNLMTSCIDGV